MSSRKRLDRIYRIRQMEEDQARMTLESSVAQLRRTQLQVGEAMAEEQGARVRRNGVLGELNAEMQAWMGPESEAQLQRVIAVRTARTLPRLEFETQKKREGYIDRRRERQKLESLLTKAKEKEASELERRSRAELDDLVLARRRYEELRVQREEN
jgi:flagellar export protein FliJ